MIRFAQFLSEHREYDHYGWITPQCKNIIGDGKETHASMAYDKLGLRPDHEDDSAQRLALNKGFIRWHIAGQSVGITIVQVGHTLDCLIKSITTDHHLWGNRYFLDIEDTQGRTLFSRFWDSQKEALAAISAYGRTGEMTGKKAWAEEIDYDLADRYDS